MASKRQLIRESLLGFPMVRLGKGSVSQQTKRRHQASVPWVRHVERRRAGEKAKQVELRRQHAQYEREADLSKLGRQHANANLIAAGGLVLGAAGGWHLDERVQLRPLGGAKIAERVAKLLREGATRT